MWLPLVGFRPMMVLTMQAISLLYQFWIHTELVSSLGPLELVLNTPSHHRGHHGSNPCYIDRNHGGSLIIWDRLFGTFEPENRHPGKTAHSEEDHRHCYRGRWRFGAVVFRPKSNFHLTGHPLCLDLIFGD
jgi:sterol desaturase/sphingolipid hydroxylase (fatty acid hydroxylase superfamily)